MHCLPPVFTLLAHPVTEGRAHQRALHHWPRLGCQKTRLATSTRLDRLFHIFQPRSRRSSHIFFPALFSVLSSYRTTLSTLFDGSLSLLSLPLLIHILSPFLELFADSCGIAHLRQCFAELKELVRASLHPDLQQMADNANLRKSLFPRLDPLRLASLLEKVLYSTILFHSHSTDILSLSLRFSCSVANRTLATFCKNRFFASSLPNFICEVLHCTILY